MAQVFLIFFLILLALPALGISSETDLKEKSSKREWRGLLFYSGKKSLVINSDFFLDKDGQKDPYKELLAVVTLLEGRDESAIEKFACKFPARYSYVSRSILKSNKTYFCDEFISWRDSFESDGLSLMFASQYLENPASSFGHTYLKINSSQKALYLNKVISFAANIPKDVGAPEYLWKGLTGGFPGYFSVHPFYFLYHEYANMEQRDIWEYELDFNEKETKELLAILYEFIFVAEFDYLFLTDNCSSLLLRLLDIKVGKDLIEELPFYVVPIETVKVLKKNNLVRKSIFHPSIISRMNGIAKELSEEELVESLRYIRDEKPLSEDASARTLDLSLEYLNFLRQKQAGELEKKQREDFDDYLHMRSRHPSGGIPQLAAIDPLEASNPLRFSLGLMQLDKRSIGYSWQIRPVGKDFLDRPNGFVKESEVNFFKTQFSYHTESPEKLWGRIDIIGIRKYGNYEPINRSASWGANLSIENRVEERVRSSYYSEIDSFYGIGKSFFQDLFLAYFAAHPTLQVGNLGQHINLLPQGEWGIIHTGNNWSFKTSYFLGSRYDFEKWQGMQRLRTTLSYFQTDHWSLYLNQSSFKMKHSFNAFELGVAFYL
jgi:hypothetical protein